MSREWHKEMQKKFREYGRTLKFIVERGEKGIPKGRIDCVWELEKPIPQYFIAFEFETSQNIRNTVANLSKVLSIPPQRMPRFLIQIYEKKLKEEDKEYLQDIARTLPVAIKTIDGVGSDVDDACQNVLVELFNWIGEHIEIPDEFLHSLERIIPRERIIKVLHFGEGYPNHLGFLNNVLYFALKGKDRLIWIKSVWSKAIPPIGQNILQRLSEFDVVDVVALAP
ncbi:MAG: hypothetical protein ACUVTD_05680 [Nitrososphaerales archaeon]